MLFDKEVEMEEQAPRLSRSDVNEKKVNEIANFLVHIHGDDTNGTDVHAVFRDDFDCAPDAAEYVVGILTQKGVLEDSNGHFRVCFSDLTDYYGSFPRGIRLDSGADEKTVVVLPPKSENPKRRRNFSLRDSPKISAVPKAADKKPAVKIEKFSLLEKGKNGVETSVSSEKVAKHEKNLENQSGDVMPEVKNTKLLEKKFLVQAARAVVTNEKAGEDFLEKKFKIGPTCSRNTLKALEHFGIVGPTAGKRKRREILVQEEDIEDMIGGDYDPGNNSKPISIIEKALSSRKKSIPAHVVKNSSELSQESWNKLTDDKKAKEYRRIAEVLAGVFGPSNIAVAALLEAAEMKENKTLKKPDFTAIIDGLEENLQQLRELFSG